MISALNLGSTTAEDDTAALIALGATVAAFAAAEAGNAPPSMNGVATGQRLPHRTRTMSVFRVTVALTAT